MFAKTQRGTREGGKRRGKNENEEERWRGDGGGGLNRWGGKIVGIRGETDGGRREGGKQRMTSAFPHSWRCAHTHTHTQKRPPPSLCVNMCVKSSFDVCVLISEFTPALFAVEVRAR